MPENHECLNSFLPSHWNRHVKSALLNIVSLARLACVHTWAWAAGSLDTRTRLAAQLQQARAEIALLREELRIKDARMAQIPAHRRPHYPPTERMAILELRAARGWNQVQTAKAMLVTPETVAAWNRRVDEQGPHALGQLPEPVNRFPDFVRYIVRRLKALCPTLGKVGIARILARAGLHLAATTVGQILKGEPPCPDQATTASEDMLSIEAAVLVNQFPCPSSGGVTCFSTVTYGSLRHACSQLLSEADLPENHGCPNLFLPHHWSPYVSERPSPSRVVKQTPPTALRVRELGYPEPLRAVAWVNPHIS